MGKKKETNSQIILYRAEDGRTQVEVNLQKEMVWLDTHQMALLFGRDRTVILRHISNVYNGRIKQENNLCKNCTGCRGNCCKKCNNCF